MQNVIQCDTYRCVFRVFFVFLFPFFCGTIQTKVYFCVKLNGYSALSGVF